MIDRASIMRGAGMIVLVIVTVALALFMPKCVPDGSFTSPVADASRSVDDARPRAGTSVTATVNGVTVTRSLPTAGFAIAAGEALDARLPAGTMSGTIEIRFDAGAVSQARLGARIEGAAINGHHREDIIVTEAAPDAPRVAMSREMVHLGRGLETFVIEFEAISDSPVSIRGLWQPEAAPQPLLLPGDGSSPTADPIVRGQSLVAQFGCVSCHASSDEDRHARLARFPAPDLGAIGARARPEWIRAWLRDPRALREDALMPRPMLRGAAGFDETVENLTHFLLTLGGPMAPDPSREAETEASLVATGDVLYHDVGCAACHGVRRRVAAPHGDAAAPKPWREYVTLGPLAEKTSSAALASFILDPLAAWPSGLMPNIDLGPLEADAIAAYLLATSDASAGAVPNASAPFTVDPARAVRGGEAYKTLGCTQCHATGEGMPRGGAAATALERVRIGYGCLSNAALAGETPDVPGYALTDDERADIIAYLDALPERQRENAPIDDLLVSMDALRCTRCHAWHGAPGPEAAMHPIFVAATEVDLGDEGRFPPTLNDAGARLTSSWIDGVLERDERARPYLATRMPNYGAGAAHVREGLVAAGGYGTDDTEQEPEFSVAMARDGHVLTGDTHFNCIQCHTIAGADATGTPGPDLAQMPGRLRYSHFARWLHDPARVVPGTRMPSYFVDGYSGFTEIQGGEANGQVDAVWHYLSQGENLPLPAGVQTGAGFELLVEDEPIVFRTFMANAGVRAIACGYPEQVHCAFDADRCTVTSVWTGRFLNAAGAWGARGGAETNPAGLVWTAPEGTFLSVEGYEDAKTKFRGYRLGGSRRPTFMYEVEGVLLVRETPEPRSDPPGLNRRLDFLGNPGAVIMLRPGDARVNGAYEEVDAYRVELNGRGEASVTVEIRW